MTPLGNQLQTGHCAKGTVDGPFQYDEVGWLFIQKVSSGKGVAVSFVRESFKWLVVVCE